MVCLKAKELVIGEERMVGVWAGQGARGRWNPDTQALQAFMCPLMSSNAASGACRFDVKSD